jgi:hypothetical protein
VWKSALDGRTLHFHLAGINNQNFIMRDEETGSWWQQITGCAILGPSAGRCLESFAWDEVTFAVWKREHPRTLVLLPDEDAKDDYATAEWEKKVAEYPTVTPIDPQDSLKPRDLVVGVSLGTAATAYPMTALAARNPIADSVGDTPVLILLHPDGRSLRCFDRRVAAETLDLTILDPTSQAGASPPLLGDGTTGSTWDFSGLATAGPLKGQRLGRVACLKDYWFDWKTYHPDTRVFAVVEPAQAE